MGRVNHYLLKNFSSLFSSLFFTLFFITSVVFFIKIASITSVIKINFIELGVLYIYLLPNILTYTLPITFFIAVCISLFNLSKENEIIVLFTLGYNPKKIAKLFSIAALILSTLLVTNILVLVPIAKQLNANFLDYKRAEAKFNIKATEFGQKFSNWLVYIDKSDEKDTYSGVVMYQNKANQKNENIITAKNADIKNYNNTLKLKLENGKVFQIEKEKIEQINFKKMFLKSNSNERVSEVKDIVSYWREALTDERRAFDLSFFLLIALFPVATILFGVSIGIVTYRYERKGIYLSMIGVIIAYLAPGIILVKYGHFYALFLVFLLSITLSYIYYRKKIQIRY